jgi:ABC-type transport system substrate-binding protein
MSVRYRTAIWLAVVALVGLILMPSCGPSATTVPEATEELADIAPSYQETAPATEEVAPPTAESPAAEGEMPRSGGDLVVGISVPLENLDGTKTAATVNQGIIRHFVEGLVRYGTEGEGPVVPQLAKSWSLSDDQLTWTFELVEGAEFSDGTPFNADAVVANVQRWLDESTTVYNRGNWGTINGAEAVDEYTVKITTSEPFLGVLEGLSYALSSMYSPKDLEAYSDDVFGTQMLSGTGPYRIKEFVAREKLVLERFDDYWGEPPHLDTITFVTIPDAAARLAALEAGEIDVDMYLEVSQVERVRGNPDLQLLSSPAVRIAYFHLNQLVPPLDDPLVRLAMMHAIDRQAIAEKILGGHARVADAWMSQGAIDYLAMDDFPQYDPDQARAELDEAGWTVGPSGIREKDGQPLKLFFQAPRGRWLRDAETAEALAGYLKEVGIDTELQISEFPTFFDAIRADNRNETNEVVLMSMGYVNPAHVLGQMYVCERVAPPGYNFNGYCNEDYEALAAEFSSTTDSSRRMELMKQMQQKLIDDVVDLPLYQLRYLVAANKTVHDVALAPMETHRFHYVWLGE